MISADTILHEQHDLSNFPQLCRLCGNLKDSVVSIYDETKSTNYCEVINTHISSIQISRTDILPLKLCIDCLTSVISWHEFHKTCVQVDQKLRAVIKKFNITKPLNLETNESTSKVTNDIEVIEVVGCENYEFYNDDTGDYKESILIDESIESYDDFKASDTADISVTENQRKNFADKSPEKNILCAAGDYLFVDTTSSVDTKDELSAVEHSSRCVICGSMFLQSKINSMNNRGTCYLCHVRGKNPRIKGGGRRKSGPVKLRMLSRYSVKDEYKQTYFQCDLCSFSCEPYPDVFTHHYRTEHPDENLKLNDTDGKAFASDQIVFRDNSFFCIVCERKYVSAKNAKRHLKRVHDDKKYYCKICHKRFTFLYRARIHERRHSKLSPFSCHFCNRKFAFKKNLRYHLTNKLCIKYSCYWCGEMFQNKRTLREHVHACGGRVVMPEEPPTYKCSNCDKQFTTKAAMRRHIIIENNLTPYPCVVCGRAFAAQQQLVVHAINCSKKVQPDDDFLVLVNADETYTCKICSKVFLKFDYIKQHMKLHSGVKPYVCQFCGKAYALRASLQSHMLTELNLRRYACSVCGKRYNTSSHLTAHTKKHHRLREFKCTTCDKDFAYLRDLNEHNKSHDQVKPFFCDKCGGFFKTERYLKKHLARCSVLKK